MSVTLRKRPNSDGTTSLILDIYNNGKRNYEFLKHLKLLKPSNPLEKQANSDKLFQAKQIVVKRAQELSANDYDMVSESGKKTIVTEWMKSYVETYTKKDKRNMDGALSRFKDFLKEEKKEQLTFGQLNALLIEDFMEYLEAHSKGEGASSYFSRFKKMMRTAFRKRLMATNVLELVERKIKGKANKKDILTLDELKILAATQTESTEVRKAFLFSCVTGLRWCDVKQLKWESINWKQKSMTVKQSKTGEDVSTPLNETAMKLLSKNGNEKEYVFDLPTANGANKTIKAWVKRAEIQKKITWHNARHSYGTNLIFNDVDILTTSKLLGHKSLKHTQRYVDIANEMKQKATEKVNIDL